MAEPADLLPGMSNVPDCIELADYRPCLAPAFFDAIPALGYHERE